EGGERRGRRNGEGGGPDFIRASTTMQFTDEDRANAKLPLAPEEDTGLQVLLRPGLLADVEIIVENIPNALHIPAQAVFEREGKQVVYVQTGKRFEEREIKLVKRSESIMVLASGVNPGEVIAMSDPYAKSKRGGKKGGGEKKSGGGGMGVMPGGGAKQ
ncbi:MAG: hypothetical protein M1436_04735, partial [Acidobacteria bacterium]|nr:hypothetical protein [Acidobacteriota bacterium]